MIFVRTRGKRRLHSVIRWTTPTLRRHPVNVLRDILNVTCFTMDTVLSVDLQSFPISRFHWDKLVHTFFKENAYRVNDDTLSDHCNNL